MPIGAAGRRTLERGDNTQEPFVKRVTLPSGKSIEVLYFGEQSAPSASALPGEQLHVVQDEYVDLPEALFELAHPVATQ